MHVTAHAGVVDHGSQRGRPAISDHSMKVRVSLGGSAAFIRFYGELNDFLPPARRGRMLAHPL